jgi:rhamnosyltransferase subunit B
LKIFLGAVGSGGDVNPMLTLGAELQRRGHECTILAGEWQASAAYGLGLAFHPILWSQQFAHYSANAAAAQSSADAWITFFYDAVFPAIAPVVQYVREHASPGQTLLIGASHVLGLRLAAERWNLPHVTTLVQPEPVRRPLDDPFSLHFNGLFGRLFKQQRIAIGLNPSDQPFSHWMETRRLSAALFPRWFVLPGIDATPDEQTLMLDFLFDDPLNPTTSTPPAVDAFLATYESPLVFTFGTGNAYARRLFEEAIHCAQTLGRPAILLTRERSQVPVQLPREFLHVDYVALGNLLPYASAIVHHGGIGTCAQALRAGIPQLVTPRGFDQFDNATRVQEFGVGDRLLWEQVSRTELAQTLDAVLRSAQIRDRCAAIRERFDPAHTIAWCCDAIEALGRQ